MVRLLDQPKARLNNSSRDKAAQILCRHAISIGTTVANTSSTAFLSLEEGAVDRVMLE